MRNKLYILAAAISLMGLSACNDDDTIIVGAPMMDINLSVSDGCFGDSLPFTIQASDADVALSTLKAQLYYGEEQVMETVIRTKVNGDTYSGKIYAPFWAGIPNGKATLRYVLQNINFTTSEHEAQIALTRPDYPYLTLVAEDGTEYRMERTDLYQYSATSAFPKELQAYIKAPVVSEYGNEITFGSEGGVLKEGSTSLVTFSSTAMGSYAITFNTLSYEASPFTKILIDGSEMQATDSENFYIDLNLRQGQLLTFDGLPEYDEWTIDADYFKKQDSGELEFLPISGSYRIIANLKLKYFFVYALSAGEAATLQSDGTGALWIIGEGIGKPSLAAKEVGWTTENALCMSQLEAKKYQITVVAGRSVKAESINFKFFHQQGWGGEFSGADLTSLSDIVGVGTGTDGHDNGNLYLRDGQTLAVGHIYKFVVDLTAGISSATLSVTDEGEQPIEVKTLTFGGAKMESADGELYTVNVGLTQGQQIAISGIGDLADWWINPDYFTYEGGTLSFIPMSGDYRVVANTVNKYFAVARLNGSAEATTNDDGSGAIWLMGWGVGSPSLDNQFGWTPGAAYCMPEVAPKIYRFTCTAGPEVGSSVGQRIRFDYLSCKFFFQDGWGGEFSGGNALTIAPGSEAFITDKGNIELADGVQLEEGATYVMTVDLSNGTSNGVLSFEKK